MAPIKVGIVGYGNSPKIYHLPFILPNSDLEVYAFLQRAEAPKDTSAALRQRRDLTALWTFPTRNTTGLVMNSLMMMKSSLLSFAVIRIHMQASLNRL